MAIRTCSLAYHQSFRVGIRLSRGAPQTYFINSGVVRENDPRRVD
jgi:hypothetical protein